jgi:flagellar motor switch protein FliG
MSATRFSLRQAAVLIASLDPPVADQLLEQIGAGKAAKVRTAMAELGEVPASEKQGVIKEFLRIGPLIPPRDSAGIELDHCLPEKITAATQTRDQVVPTAEAPPLRFLHEADMDTLTHFLLRERPETIAVVLSHLPAPRSAAVVAGLPRTMQAEVLRRLVELDATDSEIVRRVECELESLLSDPLHKVNERSAGLTAAREILSAISPGERRQLLAELSGCDAELAEKLRRIASRLPGAPATNPADRSHARADFGLVQPAPIAAACDARPDALSDSSARATIAAEVQPAVEIHFNDLADFDNLSLAAILHTADPQVALLALTGAPASLVDRILKQVPPQEAKTLRRKMGQLGPIRLTDVEQAQQYLVDLAAELVDAGTVRLPASRRFIAAV